MNPPDLPEALKRGDRTAWKIFNERYVPAIKGTAIARVRGWQGADPDDLVSDILEKFWEQILRGIPALKQTRENDDPFMAWIICFTKDRITDWKRSKLTRKNLYGRGHIEITRDGSLPEHTEGNLARNTGDYPPQDGADLYTRAGLNNREILVTRLKLIKYQEPSGSFWEDLAAESGKRYLYCRWRSTL